MASYIDISKITGLSLGTISNVLQGKSSVKPVNREKVFSAMEKLGYRINSQARALASGRQNLYGLIVSDLSKIPEESFLMPLEKYAEIDNSLVVLATSENDPFREKKNCESLLSHKVKVVFIYFHFLENKEYFQKLSETETTPIIFLGRYLENARFPYVAVDNQYAAFQMVDYVYLKGHRELLYLEIEESAMLSANKERREGVKKKCSELGMDFSLLSLPMEKNDAHVGFSIGEKLIFTKSLPKLVFPRDDDMAVGFYSACTKYGVRVPENVSIMSFGKIYPDNITPKVLSTFDRQLDRLMLRAISLSEKIVEANRNGFDLDNQSKKIYVKGKLVKGETVFDLN